MNSGCREPLLSGRPHGDLLFEPLPYPVTDLVPNRLSPTLLHPVLTGHALATQMRSDRVARDPQLLGDRSSSKTPR